MLVLHANWHADGLQLWMESLERARSRQGGAGAPSRVHPFALPSDAVLEELRRLALLPDPACRVSHRSLTLLLPHMREGMPAASDRLAPFLDQDLEWEENLTLDSIEVPAVRLEPADAVRFLAAIHDFDGRDGVVAGHDLRFFGALGRFVIELLTDQRVVPTLLQSGDGDLHAAWRPWLADGDAAEKSAALVASMPAIARAVDECDRADGAALVESALGSMTDALVREALVAENYLEALDGADRTSDPHSAWLSGLLGTESRVQDPSGEASLLRHTRQWIHLLDEATEERAMRLLLELHEPAAAEEAAESAESEEPVDSGRSGDPPLVEVDAGPWRLSFSLVSADSPPIVIPAEQIWRDTSGAAGQRRAANAEQASQTLLAELGRASRLYPRLEAALSEGAPTGLDLDTREAYAFLTEYMPLLDESGVRVLAPE
ncbi:MAG: hypothetical protein FJ253_12765, partial [Phycisphaerae bacterium]|nr:hypothetical protein [Phycisphaerae bacterium]